jgi:hypothetical protein
MNSDLRKEKCCNLSAGFSGTKTMETIKSILNDSVSTQKLIVPVAVKAVALEDWTPDDFAKMVHSVDFLTSRLTKMSEVINLYKKSERTKAPSECDTYTGTEAKDTAESIYMMCVGSAFTAHTSLQTMKESTKSESKKDLDEIKEPVRRWNREDDRHLWRIIREIAEDEGEEFENVVGCIISSDYSPYWDKIVPILKSQGEYILLHFLAFEQLLPVS